MFFTRKRILTFSGYFIIILAIRIFSSFPELIERYYSTGIYVYLSKLQRAVTGIFPFSLGDIFYGIAIIWVIRKLVKILWNFNEIRASPWSYLSRVAWKIFNAGCIIYIWFNISWGLNYNRPSLMEEFAHPVTHPEKEDLVELMEFLHNRMTEDFDDAVTGRNALNDNRYIYKEAAKAFNKLALEEPEYAYSPSSLKTSLYSYAGNYLGFTGYYNPFSGEAQVNTSIPEFARPFVACHEIAHQLGRAKENEANFTGFRAAISSEIPAFRYSAYFDMYFYSRRILYRMDTLLVRSLDEKMHPGVKEDYNRLTEFHSSFKNPVEAVIDRLYGRYLQANQQPSGKESYAEGVLLLLSWRKSL